MSKSIFQRVDEVFDALEETQREAINAYVNQLHSTMREAERSASRRMLVFVFLWFVSYLVATGTVQEGQLGPIKIQELKNLLPIFPVLMAIIAYGTMVSNLARTHIRNAISRAYKHLLPKVYEHDLEYLSLPPSYRNVEGFIRSDEHNKFIALFSSAWNSADTIFIAFGTLLGLSHVSYLGFKVETNDWWLLAISLSISLIFWMRGVTMIVTSPRTTNIT